MARPTNFKLRVRMEDDDPHQPQAPWPPRLKVKVARSRDQSEPSWPNEKPAGGAHRVGRTRRPHFLFYLTDDDNWRAWRKCQGSRLYGLTGKTLNDWTWMMSMKQHRKSRSWNVGLWRWSNHDHDQNAKWRQIKLADSVNGVDYRIIAVMSTSKPGLGLVVKFFVPWTCPWPRRSRSWPWELDWHFSAL